MKTRAGQFAGKAGAKALSLGVRVATRKGVSAVLASYSAKLAILGPFLHAHALQVPHALAEHGVHLPHLPAALVQPLAAVMAQSEPIAAALLGAAVGVRIPHRVVAEGCMAVGAFLACAEPSGTALHLMGTLMACMGVGGCVGEAGGIATDALGGWIARRHVPVDAAK